MTANTAVKKINQTLYWQIVLSHTIANCMLRRPNAPPPPLICCYFHRPSFKNWLKIRNEFFLQNLQNIVQSSFYFLISTISVECVDLREISSIFLYLLLMIVSFLSLQSKNFTGPLEKWNSVNKSTSGQPVLDLICGGFNKRRFLKCTKCIFSVFIRHRKICAMKFALVEMFSSDGHPLLLSYHKACPSS